MKTILITGANGNLGISVVKALHAQGHQIIALIGRGSAEEIANIPNVFVQSIDILNTEATAQFIQEITQKFPQLDVVITLVGAFAEGNLIQTDKTTLDKMFNLNFYSVFNVIRPAFTYFESNSEGGKFIFIGARPALNPNEGKDTFAYSLSKALVFKTAELLNAEGKEKNITASVIVPSTLDTPATRSAAPEADFSKWVPTEKVAELVAFMLSDAGMMLKEDVLKMYHKA